MNLATLPQLFSPRNSVPLTSGDNCLERNPEKHSITADSYYLLGATQHALGDFTSAIQSRQRVLDIRRKGFGEEHSSTADSYHLLGVKQNAQGDFTTAAQSEHRAFNIRRKLTLTLASDYPTCSIVKNRYRKPFDKSITFDHFNLNVIDFIDKWILPSIAALLRYQIYRFIDFIVFIKTINCKADTT